MNPLTPLQLQTRANALVDVVYQTGHEGDVMVGGAPFFMRYLENALLNAGYQPVYAFSRRTVREERQPNGESVKRSVFRHLGMVPVFFDTL